jgi:hypothetical protein
VTPQGLTAYLVNGTPNPDLTFERGKTYMFSVNAVGHPFYIKTDPVIGTGSQWTQGVTGNGVTIGTCTFAVPASAPDQLFYQCGVHSTMGGSLNITSPVGVPQGGGSPTAWLGPASPNPSKQGASFKFGIPRSAQIDFALFDLHGRRMRDLSSGALSAGPHAITWDGRDHTGRLAASGVYYYRLQVEDRVLSGRLVVSH